MYVIPVSMIEKRKESRSSATRPANPHRTAKGPEPERFKIEGYGKWEDAAAALVRKQKPPGGWPK